MSVNTIRDQRSQKAEMGMTNIFPTLGTGKRDKKCFLQCRVAMGRAVLRSLLRFDVFCYPGWR